MPATVLELPFLKKTRGVQIKPAGPAIFTSSDENGFISATLKTSYINTTYTLRSTVLLTLVLSDGVVVTVATVGIAAADDDDATDSMVPRPMSLIFSASTSSSLLASS